MKVKVVYRYKLVTSNNNVVTYNADAIEIKNNCLVLYEEKNPHGIADDYTVSTIPFVNIESFTVDCDLYTIRDRETKTGICTAGSKEEAIRKIREFEFEDMTRNVYSPNFYEYIKKGENEPC